VHQSLRRLRPINYIS